MSESLSDLEKRCQAPLKLHLLNTTRVSQYFSQNGHKVTDMWFSVVEWINKDPQSSNDCRF